MEKSTARTILLGLLGLGSLLLSSVGYLYGHKLIAAGSLAAVITAFWQILTALMLLSLSGAIGERLLSASVPAGLIRFGLAAALGAIIMSLVTLLLGATIGTSLLIFIAEGAVIAALVIKAIPAWWRNLAELPTSITDRYHRFLSLGTCFILAIGLAFALAPPAEFDSLSYHLAIPLSYLQQGRIVYLPGTMFWGMPQLAEVLYVPLMRLAGSHAASVFVLLSGAVSMVALLGFMRSIFTDSAAWTAVAALVVGENLAHSLSTAYVDWMSILFGLAAVIAVYTWLQERQWRLLLLAGVFCGGALGTKYTAGVVLIGVMVALILLSRGQPMRKTFGALLLVGFAAVIVTMPWWIKNFLGTGNPFYPFFFPSGAMDQNRLDFYQKVPVWKDWRAVILLPWQATFWGIDGKEGFSTSIGALLVGLSPLAWIRWCEKTESQKLMIRLASVVTVVALLLWGIGSRISGLLLQTRLYMAFFPAWAMLAGAGFHAIVGLRTAAVRFARLLIVLISAMFCMSLFFLITNFLHYSPAAYEFGLETESSYLNRNLGAYAAAMDQINALPAQSRVLMLWEARGYYCQPRCDSDEVIDRWYDDSHTYATPQAIIAAWRQQGYTDLLVFDLGKDFVQTYDYPQEEKMHWSMLDATLNALPVEQQIGEGAYTLYKIP